MADFSNQQMLWTLGAAVSFCGYNLINRKLSSMGYNALEIVTYSMLCGALLLGLWSVRGINELFAANQKIAAQPIGESLSLYRRTAAIAVSIGVTAITILLVAEVSVCMPVLGLLSKMKKRSDRT